MAMRWDKLADEVRRRRKLLELTQADVAERGGPSVATIGAIETNRAGRLSRRSRRALERVIEWESGSVDDVLAGGHPRPLEVARAEGVAPASQDVVATERFALAERVLEMKRTLARHQEDMTGSAREELQEQIARSAREVEEAVIKMLPWLNDQERGQALRILTLLRE
jgi:transcriptional regulator with XRE-family HTH domain